MKPRPPGCTVKRHYSDFWSNGEEFTRRRLSPFRVETQSSCHMTPDVHRSDSILIFSHNSYCLASVVYGSPGRQVRINHNRNSFLFCVYDVFYFLVVCCCNIHVGHKRLKCKNKHVTPVLLTVSFRMDFKVLLVF